MSNFKIATKDDVKNAGFVFVKDVNTQEVKKIATSADFQVGLSNVPASLTITGGDLTSLATTFNLLNEPITRTTNIATGAAAQTVILGSTTGASSLTLNAGTGTITLGQSIETNTINIGNANTATGATQTINIGAGTPTGSGKAIITIGNSFDASSITINAGSGSINIGTTPQVRTTNIATGAAAQTVTLGSTTGDSSLTLSAGIGNINIGTDGGARTTNIATTTVGTQTINIGTFSSNADIIRIGNFGSSPASTTAIYGDTIDIGTSATVAVTLGSTTGASSLTLNAGTGGIKKPNQPAFLAYMSANQNNFAIDTEVTVLFNSEVFDQADNFTVGLFGIYTFTAPVTGRYIFNVAVRLQTVDITATFYSLQLVTPNRIYRIGIIDPNFSANLVYWYLNGSVIADMDTNDTAYVRIYQSGGTAVDRTDIISGNNSPQLDSYFSGFLLG